MNHLSPDRLLQTGLAFRASKAMLSAVELGLFTELGRGPRTVAQLRRSLAVNERAAADLLDALVAMGVLDREGDDAQAVYLNTREAGYFLDQRSPAYVGAILEAANTRLYALWGELTVLLKTGKPISGVDTISSSGTVSPSRSGSGSAIETLMEQFDFSTRRTLAYFGRGGDSLAVLLAAWHPHLQCRCVDPRDALPRVDVIVMVEVLPDGNLEGKRDLLRRAYAALPAGGCLIAIEALIDDERRRNLFALLASIDAALQTGGGFGFSGSDLHQWCLGVGFRGTEVIPLTGISSAVVALK